MVKAFGNQYMALLCTSGYRDSQWASTVDKQHNTYKHISYLWYLTPSHNPWRLLRKQMDWFPSCNHFATMRVLGWRWSWHSEYGRGITRTTRYWAKPLYNWAQTYNPGLSINISKQLPPLPNLVQRGSIVNCNDRNPN
jgi:hypothetical protein